MEGDFQGTWEQIKTEVMFHTQTLLFCPNGAQ